MTYSYFWLSTGLASLFVLALLSTTSCLFLVRRLDGLTRAHDAIEQRVIQLAYELRRLELSVETRSRIRPGAGGFDRPEDEPDSLISVPDLADDAPAHRGGDDALAAKHGDVWALVEAGRSAQEIARETGRPIGQIELIVGLYRRHLAVQSQEPHAEPS